MEGEGKKHLTHPCLPRLERTWSTLLVSNSKRRGEERRGGGKGREGEREQREEEREARTAVHLEDYYS